MGLFSMPLFTDHEKDFCDEVTWDRDGKNGKDWANTFPGRRKGRQSYC